MFNMLLASAPLDRTSQNIKFHMISGLFYYVERDHANHYVYCFIFVLTDELGSLGVDFGKFLIN